MRQTASRHPARRFFQAGFQVPAVGQIGYILGFDWAFSSQIPPDTSSACPGVLQIHGAPHDPSFASIPRHE